MTVMNADGSLESVKEKQEEKKPDTAVPSGDEGKKKAENVFSDDNLAEDVNVGAENGKGGPGNDVVITAEDKISFMDSVVNNTRFTKEYSLFGGKVKLTIRSITADESNALSTWVAKEGIRDSAGLVSGRYRKYLLAAQVARYNGVDMPPLDLPLFETIDKDGKTVPPGWVNRCDAWDGYGYGVFQAIVNCIHSFDSLYAALCGKAEDANFWNPDTP